MKLIEEKQSEKMWPFLFTCIWKNGSNKKRKNLFPSSSSQTHAKRISFRFVSIRREKIFEAKLLQPTLDVPF
jgi:hypothetical protein